jgi:hypothetical protein
MSSYNRMLVHRTAAYFGMDHNVDSTQQCVIASVSKETRLPDVSFIVKHCQTNQINENFPFRFALKLSFATRSAKNRANQS